MATGMAFTPRGALGEYVWDTEREQWRRPVLEREVLQELSKRSTLNGLWRTGVLVFFLAASAGAAIYVGRYSFWAAVPLIYVYFFFAGFWVAIGHELQHKIVFGRGADWFSEILFYVFQTLMWNSPRYARISHRLHHRYTMVRGIDPETDWPEVFTSKWVKGYFRSLILRVLIVGAVVEVFRWTWIQVKRILGIKDRMMRDHCSDKDILVIRLESLWILAFHAAVVAGAIVYRRWEPLVFITLAWHVGSGMESLWHQTEHIGRLYNVNDQRLCTRSVRVGPFIHLIYWGLDNHVDHHLFPGVPSYNLPRLHRILKDELPEPKGMVACWREMFAIAREKDLHPEHEYVPGWGTGGLSWH